MPNYQIRLNNDDDLCEDADSLTVAEDGGISRDKLEAEFKGPLTATSAQLLDAKGNIVEAREFKPITLPEDCTLVFQFQHPIKTVTLTRGDWQDVIHALSDAIDGWDKDGAGRAAQLKVNRWKILRGKLRD